MLEETNGVKRYLVQLIVASVIAVAASCGWAADQVVDVSTRAGVTVRLVLIIPDNPKATVVLFAGGHGGLQIASDGKVGWGATNFLVRTRQLFADQGLMVAVVDAPSDRPPLYLSGFRTTSMHVADTRAVIAWLRQKANVPVWLVGTSRGTQSAAYITTELAPSEGGPDGLVLTSTILVDPDTRTVPEMELQKVRVPTLIVPHRDDACRLCPYREARSLIDRLPAGIRKELVTVDGGRSHGDPCQALAHHGFNGQEAEVVAKIATWITAR